MSEKIVVKAIPSSFVFNTMKLASDVGSGEAKLFIGSKANEAYYDSFFDFDSEYTYSFDKENVKEYLREIKLEFVYQSINKYSDAGKEKWEEIYGNICALNEKDFEVHIEKFVDSSRYYIKDTNKFLLVRKLIVPKLTNITFLKDDINKHITALLEVNYDYSNADNDLTIFTDPQENNYSIQELGNILREMYDNCGNGAQVASIILCGIKYGKIIKANDYKPSAIVKAAGLNDSYYSELTKGLNIYRLIDECKFGLSFVENLDKYSDGSVEGDNSIKYNDFPKRTRSKYPLNSILYGAPGTGKTFTTIPYAVAIVEDKDVSSVINENRTDVMKRYKDYVSLGRIVFTTFHQNYGYEDFIQGIRPDTSSGEMSFKTVDGVFKDIADRAILDPDNDYVIIIDEINRANISKVFGELITLIEDDKRWGEENAIQVKLPSGEPFAVPNNLYIVGTMNSADKSISLIDTALRRRFEFIEHTPDLKLIEDTKLRDVLKKLNTGISKELNSVDLLIGHSYFMHHDMNDLDRIMNRNVIPLLYEYFFDNQKKVEAQIKDATEGTDFEIKTGSMGRIKVEKKESD